MFTEKKKKRRWEEVLQQQQQREGGGGIKHEKQVLGKFQFFFLGYIVFNTT